MAFFSIIIPAYNAEKYIKDCLDSIKAQTYHDYEVIVVDDDSKDETHSIASSYASGFSNFNLVKIEKSGVSKARNTALDLAIGEYIVFVDADDRLAENMLERIYKCLMQNESDICFLPNFYVETNQGEQKRVLIPNTDDSDLAFLSQESFVNFVTESNGIFPSSMWTMVVSNNLLTENSIRLDENYTWSEDSDFTYKAFACAKKISICGFPGYIWNRKHSESTTNKINSKNILSRLSVYSKWYDSLLKGCFKIHSSKSIEQLKELMLTNYCSTLSDYSFLKGINERKLVKEKYTNDKLWNIDKELIPKEYARYGLTLGRYPFLFRHYCNRIIEIIQMKLKKNN